MTHPGTDDHDEETLFRLMALAVTTLTLHQAGWTWDQMGSFFELLAAAASIATSRKFPD